MLIYFLHVQVPICANNSFLAAQYKIPSHVFSFSSASLPTTFLPALTSLRNHPKPPLTTRLLSLPRENIYTVPNLLTFSRLLCAPLIGWLVLHDLHGWAVGLFAYAGATDLVDGWIARKWQLQTVVGTVIDPMADKTLMTVLTVSLAYQGSMPGEWTVLITFSDFCFLPSFFFTINVPDCPISQLSSPSSSPNSHPPL